MHNRAHIMQMAAQVARNEGVDPDLFLSLVEQESNFNPDAVSQKGAIGLTQLMPNTAKELGVDPSNMVQNLTGGARYLKQQLDAFQSKDLALAAYNAGPTRVKELGAIPEIEETQNFVKNILSRLPNANNRQPLNATSLLAQDQTNGNKPMSRNYNFLDYLMGNARPQPNNQRPDQLFSPLRRAGIAADALILRGYGQGDKLRESSLQETAYKKEQNTRNDTIKMFQQRAAAGDSTAAQILQGLQSGSLTVKDAMSLYYGEMFKKDTSTSFMQNYKYLTEELGMSQEDALAKAGKVTGGNTTIDMSGKGDQSKFAEGDAEKLVAISNIGLDAGGTLNRINRLEGLLQNIDTGLGTTIQSIAGRFGIQTEGLGNIQAAEALINSLVPMQRPKGSGPMSDKDLALFQRSLPSLINSPEGNQLIINTMKGIAEYDAQGADIIQRYRREELTVAETFDALYARSDPTAWLKGSDPQGVGEDPQTSTFTTDTGLTFEITNPI